MEKNVRDPQALSKSNDQTKPVLTPHQLYNYHMLHPDEPITDEDIRNLKIDSGDVYKDHQLSEEEIVNNTVNSTESEDRGKDAEEGTDNERAKASPYDILGA